MLLKLIQCTRLLDQAGDHSSDGEGDGMPYQPLVKKAEFTDILHTKLAKEQNSIVTQHVPLTPPLRQIFSPTTRKENYYYESVLSPL